MISRNGFPTPGGTPPPPFRWRSKPIIARRDMSVDGIELTPLKLPRIGTALGLAGLLCPALTVPLVVACLVALAVGALDEARAGSRVPEVPPVKAPGRRGRRATRMTEASTEDSFPASDPPSWTPVTGTGTRH